MRIFSAKFFSRHCLLLSVLIHLFFFSSFTVVWLKAPKFKKPPGMYVPSYVYEKSAASTRPSQAKVEPEPVKKQLEQLAEQPKPVESEKIALPNTNNPRSVNQMRIQTSSKKSEPIHLVGDKKVLPKPLIKLLAKALSAHLMYPKIATDFNVRGIAYVGFSLHPNGDVTDVAIVKSSQAGVLDEEALAAVRAISPVKDITPYVDKKRFMVVGIIFNARGGV